MYKKFLFTLSGKVKYSLQQNVHEVVSQNIINTTVIINLILKLCHTQVITIR